MLIVVTAVLAYGPIFGNGFAWDDGYLVLDNPAIQELSNVPNLFVQPWAAGTSYGLGARQNAPYFRPVALASMALDWSIAGPDPVVFHGTNLLLHLLSALLLWSWLRRVLGGGGTSPGPAGERGPLLALIGALLWAVHPVNTEAVSLVSYRTTLLSGLSMFAALRLLTPVARADRQPPAETGAPAAVGGVLCFAVGLLSKETTAVLPALLLAFDVLLGRLSLRRIASVYLPLAAVGVAWWFARAGVTGSDIYTWFDGLTHWQSALMVPRIFFLYVRLALLPWPLCPFYDWSVLGTPNSLLEPDILAGTLLLAGMLAAVPLLRRRLPVVAFGLAWTFLALLPVSHIMPFFDAAGDRFLYVPLAGWIVAVAGVAAALPGSPAMRRLGMGLVAVALAGFVSLTVVRTGEWRDDETILRATTRDFPQSLSAHLGLGRLYLGTGRPGAAILELSEVVRMAPSLAVAHALLAVAQGRDGDLVAARRTLRDGPPPEQGLPSVVEIARTELYKAGEMTLMHRMGL
jgi:hypothetical protein